MTDADQFAGVAVAKPAIEPRQPSDLATKEGSPKPLARYRSIAVHIKNHEDRSEQVAVAMRLAGYFDAHLTGVLTQREPSIFKKLYSAESLPLQRLEALRQQAEQARVRFEAEAQRCGVAAEFKLGEGDAAELLGCVGRLFDLIVVEQTDLSSDEIGFDVPENCLAATGRPVLVVPSHGCFPVVGRHVLLAWNGSREAALAIHHALPFIANAERITVLEGRGKERFPSVTRWPEIDLARYLTHHASSVQRRQLPENCGDAGEAILWHANTVGADLVVMGAYGRSWLAEWVLGGATRYVLRHAKIPLLMAH